MKRFLVSLIVGITFMAIGGTMMFFELKDYKAVSACDLYDKHYYSSINTFDVTNEDLDIFLEKGHGIYYEFVEDASLGNNVKIETSNYIDRKVKGNQFYVDGYYGTNYDAGDGWNAFTNVINTVIEGLKDHKLYTCDNSGGIRITCSKEAKAKVNINYE